MVELIASERTTGFAGRHRITDIFTPARNPPYENPLGQNARAAVRIGFLSQYTSHAQIDVNPRVNFHIRRCSPAKSPLKRR